MDKTPTDSVAPAPYDHFRDNCPNKDAHAFIFTFTLRVCMRGVNQPQKHKIDNSFI